MADPDRHEVTTDEELSEQLHQLLVVEGFEEVEIVHPIEGTIIVTAESYRETCQALDDVRTMSPAQRLQAKKRYERKQRNRFTKAMDSATFRTVDITDEENFGIDLDGNEIDMDGRTFVPASAYHDGIKHRPDEVGAFVEKNWQHDVRPPIRILHQGRSPLSEALQLLADECTEEERQALLDSLETVH